jgi:hypothetical protein
MMISPACRRLWLSGHHRLRPTNVLDELGARDPGIATASTRLRSFSTTSPHLGLLLRKDINVCVMYGLVSLRFVACQWMAWYCR